MNRLVDIFDFDGTLVDSLDAHVRFYQDIARELGFELLRERVIEAIQRPIMKFYEALGFREEDWKLIDRAYEKRFTNYPCPVFSGIPELLRELKERERVLCVASFNRRKCVDAFFSEYLHFFDEVHTRDNGGKLDGIRGIREKYGKADYLLIGDTLWDMEDARDADVRFLGASYGGWYNFSEKDNVEFVRSIPELAGVLVGRGG